MINRKMDPDFGRGQRDGRTCHGWAREGWCPEQAVGGKTRRCRLRRGCHMQHPGRCAVPAAPGLTRARPLHLLLSHTLPPGAAEPTPATQAEPLEFCSNGPWSPSPHLVSLFNIAFSFQISRASPLLTFSCNSALCKTWHIFY